MPFTDIDNGDRRIVEVGRFERLIVLAALDNYDDTLKKVAKKESDLGVTNLELWRRRCAIKGEEGWGRSLRGKFAEFGSDVELGDQMDLEAGVVEETPENVQAVLLGVGVELPVERVALLTGDELHGVLKWASLAEMAERGDELPESVPPRPPVLNELALSDEVVERWLEAGPWRPVWDSTPENEADNVAEGPVVWLAENRDEAGAETSEAWPSEARARLGCAYLNRAIETTPPAPLPDFGPTTEDQPDLMRYECAQCSARPGEPCRSVGHKPIVEVHMARLKSAGIEGDGHLARARYTDAAIMHIFGYVTDDLRKRAKKDRAIDVTKTWAAEALRARPAMKVNIVERGGR